MTVCFFLNNCGNTGRKIEKEKTHVHLNSIEIEFNKKIKRLDVSKFYNAEFIPLETKHESNIGNIDKAIIHRGFIYVLDRTKARKLFKFDLKGKFITTIGKSGKGDGEYLYLADFDIKNDLIYISSQQNNKMLIYDLKGNHKKDIRLEGYIGMAFSILNKNSIVVKNNDGSNKAAIFYNKNGNKLKSVSNGGELFRYSNEQVFFKSNNQCFMYFAFNDTIYEVDERKNDLIPYLHFEFGKRTFPIRLMKSESDMKQNSRSDKYLQLGLFSASSKYFFCDFSDTEIYNAIIEKSKNKIHYANFLTFKGFPLGNYIGATDKGPLMVWNPATLDFMQKNPKYKEHFMPNIKFKNAIDSNPGIVILSEK